MADVLDGTVDPALVDLLKAGHQEVANIERVLTPRDFHRCGLELFAQGYSAQAELCFRTARRSAFAEQQPSLGILASLDLSRTLNHRNPRLVLGVLGQLNPGELDRKLLCVFYNQLGRATGSLRRFETADHYLRNSFLAASENKDSVGMAVAMANRSTILHWHGAYTEARKMNTEATEMLIDSNQQDNIGLLVMNMASNEMHEGHYDKANDLFESLTEICRSTGNVKVLAFGLANRAELELVTGGLDDGYTLLLQAEQFAAIASLPAIQAEVLILRAIMEETLGTPALIQGTTACARDLHARELEMESAPLAVLAESLAAARGQNLKPHLPILDSTFARLEFTQVLMHHYLRMLGVLQERRCSHPVQAFPKFLTQAPTTIAIKEKLSRLVGSDVRILIEGESGTGKSFLARQFHDANGKSPSPFIIVDCTNLEENLFESKLFGHLRGSFTGAISDTVGLVEQANGGTLFLDEIGEIPTEIQGKLLYTIEEKRYRPVGAKQERRSEFRLIAASNRDIDEMLEAGTLRRDLFFRLAGFRVVLPPLRMRREDIIPLAELRLDQLNKRYKRRKSLRSEVWESLVQYSWPGNVRELNTALERGYHLSTGRRITLDDLALGLSSNGATPEDLSWYSIRRAHLLRVLKLCRGNVAKAAQMLGLNRTTLIYKLKLLDIERKDFAPRESARDQEADMSVPENPVPVAAVEGNPSGGRPGDQQSDSATA